VLSVEHLSVFKKSAIYCYIIIIIIVSISRNMALRHILSNPIIALLGQGRRHRFLTRRTFARSSESSEQQTPADKVTTFLVSIGHDVRIAKGVVDALTQNGMSGPMLLSTVRLMAGRPEVGEDNGLDALVASVQQDLARTEGKEQVSFWCVPHTAWSQEDQQQQDMMMKSAFRVQAFEGMTLTDVAKFGDGEGATTFGDSLDCACSGIMACSTCHVIIDDAWSHLVGDPTEAEQDMLDLAFEPTEKSRLGCQVVLSKELDGLIIKLPKGHNNMMDFIPFED
jgi:2Fe-2S ferredoxin